MDTPLSEGGISFGVKIGRRILDASYEAIKKIAIESERLGYRSIWHFDHFIMGGYPQFECWTVLSALASETKRIRLGTMVLSISYRYPSVLAKMAATLDVISGGRLDLGLGAGWDESEYQAYGIACPRPAVRIRQLKEGIQLMKKMWTEDRATFKGRYYAVEDAINLPKPVQKPHPPIWIGGRGEKRLLRVVAEEADGYNLAFGSPEETQHKFDVLTRHCVEIGRDPDEIERSWQGHCIIAESEKEVREKILALKPKNLSMEDFIGPRIVGTPEQCVEKIRRYVEVGATTFIIIFPDLYTAGFDPLRLFSQQVATSFEERR